MQHKGIAIIGAILLVIGLFGLIAVFAFGGVAMMSGPLVGTNVSGDTFDSQMPRGRMQNSQMPDSFRPESLGEQIYLTGVGENGAIRRSGGIGRMGSGGCVTCHGPDGQGGPIGMMGSFTEAPPITYGVLTGAHGEHDSDGETEEAWTDADIAHAVREGVTPDGRRLDPIMPRWDMNNEDMDALIDYLKTLDEE